MQSDSMNSLSFINLIYIPYNLICTNINPEPESKEYNACQFTLNNRKIIFRSAKITPTKEGQFVTLWKRSQQGPIAPYDRTDDFDIVIIHVVEHDKSGQFIFSKNILLQHNVLSDHNIGGKRALRVYPSWCQPTNKTAQKTQLWQLRYFIETTQINEKTIEQIQQMINS